MDSGRPVNENSRLEESLSALMDDEAGELELRRVLRELPANAELSGTWKRYHTARASLRQEIHSNPSVNLLEGINARLAAEADSLPAPRRGFSAGSGLLRYLGQGAIAATVAVAALMSVSVLETAQTDAPAATIAQETNAETPVLNGNFTESDLARTAATNIDGFEHLEQAVYQEFSGQAEEIPVSYVIDAPDFPVQVPAE